MADIQVDDDLDVFIDSTGDLAYAEEEDAFEQQISIALTNFYFQIIGEDDPDTIIEAIKVGARRAVDQVADIDNLAFIDAEFKDDEPNTVEVFIFFDTGEVLDFTLN